MDLSLIPPLLLDFDLTSSFNEFWKYFKLLWSDILSLLNDIKIGGVSLLSINIALTIFGLIFTVFFAVVKSGVVTSMDVGSSVRESRRRKDDDTKNGYKRYEENRHKQESYERIYKERNSK